MLRVPDDEYGRNILEKATKLAELALERHGYEGAIQHWTASRDDSAPGTFSYMFDVQVLDEIERLNRTQPVSVRTDRNRTGPNSTGRTLQ